METLFLPPPQKKRTKKTKVSVCGEGEAGKLSQRAQRLGALAVLSEVVALIPSTNVVAHCCL